ncbi:hypothetical protein HNP46_007201 [Pseudomonas nitritireducens]|uniref:Uncharacterized protein n=1 Tax=Pseudomonas nitroreducens TaxID=46680 RepID=A0A7W7KTZ1_PSENT|nr:hypothetical protein [Pseudomonas nitritireducens]
MYDAADNRLGAVIELLSTLKLVELNSAPFCDVEVRQKTWTD